MPGKWRTNKHPNEKEDWLSAEAFIKLGIIFIIVQTIGLYVAETLYLAGLAQAPFT